MDGNPHTGPTMGNAYTGPGRGLARQARLELVKAGVQETSLVDASNQQRPVGDTNTSACWITDLPQSFFGGQASLQYTISEIFSQYGKIHKISVHVDEEEKLIGTALIVYHKSKHTGKREKGDPVWDACTELDSKWRVLGKRNVRLRVEAAEWQKAGFDVKEKAKVYPCVEISNMWEYDVSRPIGWYSEMQGLIRQHAAKVIASPFVKVDPHAGSAIIWTKGANDAMKFARMMQASHFLGRKVVASLCRRERPKFDRMTKNEVEQFNMLMTDALEAAASVPSVLGQEETEAATEASLPSNEVVIQVPEGVEPGSPLTVEGPRGMVEIAIPDGVVAGQLIRVVLPAPVETGSTEANGAMSSGQSAPQKGAGISRSAADADDPQLVFTLAVDSIVVLKGLMNKPENNGRRGVVAGFLEDVGKYQIRLTDGRVVKVKPENVESAAGAKPKRKRQQDLDSDEEFDAEMAEASAAAAAGAAANWAQGEVQHGPAPLHDPRVDGFKASVCVDPSLLPKHDDDAEEEEEEAPRRDRSRSRERRMEERVAAAKARLAVGGGDRPKWVMEAPPPKASEPALAIREPEETREALLKLSVGKLKELLREYGKSAAGCLEKKDFVDRLKPSL